MNEFSVGFEFRARYYTLGKLTSSTRQIWFVLHGYGQLARFFLKKFNILSEQNIYVIAPEGLSTFYLENVSQRIHSQHHRVGATWMTRENRIMNIENYINYLNKVYRSEVPFSFNGEINVLGFSQGAATATRWVMDGAITPHRLMLWGGILPPDMNVEAGHEILKKIKVIEVFGKRDPFLTDERLMEETQLSDKLKIRPERIEFDGGHEILDTVLSQLISLQ